MIQSIRPTSMQRIAFIAIGTNLGDRGFKIRETLRKMSNIMSVESTSFLYESQPMYYRDQPEFLNAVCRVQTNASPRELLLQLKVIEKELGRENTFRNGPRAIDLDILLYEDCVMQSPELTIPHPSLAERPFVLKPLCDIDDALIHPVHGTTMRDLWKQLTIQKQQEVHRVIPCFNHCLQQTRYLRLDGQQAIIMGILNATPDSFSDGGQYSQSIDDIVAHARRLAHEGADIIDVGGESTRPGADEVSETDELARVIPAIEAIRAAGISCLISIDTRRSEVARRAILAGRCTLLSIPILCLTY